MAEDPAAWRERRIAELRDHAMTLAPPGWNEDQRDEARRTVEGRLRCLRDDALREARMRPFVENLVRTKEMYFAARSAEDDYLGRLERQIEPWRPTESNSNNEETHS